MAIGPSGWKSPPQIRQRHTAGGWAISSVAPSRLVPSVTRSKQNLSEFATTPDSAPISSRTQVTRWPGRRSVTASTRPSVMASSCTAVLLLLGCCGGQVYVGTSGSADPRQRVADQQVDDAGTAECRLELDNAGRLGRHSPDDVRVAPLRMRPQRRKRSLPVLRADNRHEASFTGHVHGV